MSIFFISDLHLNTQEPSITQLFYCFTALLKSNDQLYILGDFFNAWVGDDAATEFDKEIQTHLKTLVNKNIKIYMLYGNRDFLMRESFFKKTGLIFLKDKTVIDIHGIPTLLMHGDDLCSDDKHYLRYKRIVKNPIVQTCFLALPKSWRYLIAGKLRQNSQQRFDRTRVVIDVNQETVIKAMKEHSVYRLIHGHTHIPGIHSFEIDNIPAQRIVLGAWHEEGSVLNILDNGMLELTAYYPKTDRREPPSPEDF